jgi:hypothetical protein
MATDKVETMSAEKIDFAVTASETVSPADIQSRFPTLQDLDETQMATLNKKLLRRIDWRLMPMITVSWILETSPWSVNAWFKALSDFVPTRSCFL